MKNFKRLTNIIILFIIIVGLTSCNNKKPSPIEEEAVIEKLTILSINDFHGALDSAAKLAYLINDERRYTQANVLISAGDMFQGTALSSYNHGRTVIEVMNEMKFDAMTLGNHEFDWGYDEIYQYVDGNKANGEANFPYLGCNIIDKSTNQIVKGVKPYHLFKRGGLTIGIVGFIGEDIESSISPSFIKPYEFTSVISNVKKYVKELRCEHLCDVVIAVGHQDDRYNDQLANLNGDEKIDAIINGHSHQTYADKITRNDGTTVPYIQSGSAGENYGIITLQIDPMTKKVKGGEALNCPNKSNKQDENVMQIIDNLKNETNPIFERKIGTAYQTIYRNDCAYWAATALKNYTNVDFAVINLGGIRNQGLPIYQGMSIKVSTVHGFMPFDNIVKTVTLTGKQVKKLNSYLVFSNNVSFLDNQMYINGVKINDNEKYRVASIDFIFDNSYYPFLKGENIINTGILFRDILIQTIEQDGSIIIKESF